jgi:hypothetical protein
MTRKILAFVLFLCFAGIAGIGFAQGNYARIARLSYLEGGVSFQHANDADWAAASINMPLQEGDRIYTGYQGKAEIQLDDGSVFRLAENTDAEILSLEDNLIQFRMLLGLSTLTVASNLDFEVDTPAAAFNTLSKGVYRFDVVETGNTDGIVRSGVMEAANNQFTRQLRSGDLIHITPGDNGVQTIARYLSRDAWDEWTDRRTADMRASASAKYLPDYVYIGGSDLDRYGRWVTVELYGSAWVPLYPAADWAPYSMGRWCYRPLWGWTWVSYEPWGWLPYHYGRWYHSSRFGWCWLPGTAITFNFWSPALVSFYQGPGWVSWCPLGPGDYYNVNRFFFRRSFQHQLNEIRMLQHRGPGDLMNRNVPGAFRTAQTERFINAGPGGREDRIPEIRVDQPWNKGRLVRDQPDIKPVVRSFSPAPGRDASRPPAIADRPTIVRSEPASGLRERMTKISNPRIQPVVSEPGAPRNEAGSGTGHPVIIGGGASNPGQPSGGRPTQAMPGQVATPAPGVGNRNSQGNQGVMATPRGQTSQPPQVRRTEPSTSVPQREVPARNTEIQRNAAPRQEAAPPAGSPATPRKAAPAPRPEKAAPVPAAPGNVKPAPEAKPAIERAPIREKEYQPQKLQQNHAYSGSANSGGYTRNSAPANNANSLSNRIPQASVGNIEPPRSNRENTRNIGNIAPGRAASSNPMAGATPRAAGKTGLSGTAAASPAARNQKKR